MTDIRMTRAAGEKVAEAHARLADLEQRIRDNAEPAAGETKLTHAEIAAEAEQVQQLLRDAKALEGADDLGQIMRRPTDELAEGRARVWAANYESEEG